MIIALGPVSAWGEGRRAVPVVVAARAVRARRAWARDAGPAHCFSFARQTPVRGGGSVVRARYAAWAKGCRRDRDHGPLAALWVGAFRDEGSLRLMVNSKEQFVGSWSRRLMINSRDQETWRKVESTTVEMRAR